MQQLPKIDFSTALKAGETIALGWYQGDPPEKVNGKEKAKADKPASVPPQYNGKRSKDVDALAERLAQSEHFRGKKNEIDLLRFFPFGEFTNVLLVGLGSRKKWSLETARQTGAALL